MESSLEEYRKVGIQAAEKYVDSNFFVYNYIEVNEGIDEGGNHYKTEFPATPKISLLTSELSVTEAHALGNALLKFCYENKSDDFYTPIGVINKI